MKRAALVVVLLVGGVIVNVVCALLLSCWTTTNEQSRIKPTQEFFLRLTSPPDNWPELTHRELSAGIGITVYLAATFLDAPSDHRRRDWPGAIGIPGYYYIQTNYCYGWPCRALEYVERLYNDSVYVNGATMPAFLVERGVQSWRRLPTTPLWPGFIVNTLFYALLLWLLFFAPFALRRLIRRRRRLCEHCAYPIGASPVCTECGTTIRNHATPSAISAPSAMNLDAR